MQDLISTRDALRELLAPFQSTWSLDNPVLDCTDPVLRFCEDTIRLAADRGRVEVAAAVLIIARRHAAGRGERPLAALLRDPEMVRLLDCPTTVKGGGPC